MPSKFSSSHSRIDAQQLAENLGIFFVKFSIQDMVDSYCENLKKPLEQIRRHFSINKEDDDPVADENIQPRGEGKLFDGYL